MRVKALKYYYADKQEHHPGEEFEMDDRQSAEINLLCTIGTLEKVSSGAEKPNLSSQTVQTRSLQSEEPQSEEPQQQSSPVEPMTTENTSGLVPTPTDRKRYYRRRDMTPEKT